MDDECRVQVFARVRPGGCGNGRQASCVEVDSSTGVVRLRGDSVQNGGASEHVTSGSGDARCFNFDAVFGPDADQEEVFAHTGFPVLEECLKGFNGTILAYGQTGSGKTHSLLHWPARAAKTSSCLAKEHEGPGEAAGLLPRLVASLFEHIESDAASSYRIEAAALQVYNEQVDDLLHPSRCATTTPVGLNGGSGAASSSGVAANSAGFGLNVQNGGVVPGLTWVTCDTPDVLLDAFFRARSNLVYAETKMNKASSRSHAIFQIKITRRSRASATANDGRPQRFEVRQSRLTVVDLSGSERVKKSGVEGVQFREATAINRSLLTFGNVVSALAAKRSHVPFRESKLTRILDGSIGGNCKTALLVCLSADTVNATETLSTLEFASRALRVEVDAKVNRAVVEVSAEALLSDLNGSLEDLGIMELSQQHLEEVTAKAQAEAQMWQSLAEEAERQGERTNGELASIREQLHGLQQQLAAQAHRAEEATTRAERAEQRAAAAEAELQAVTKREENGDAAALKVAEITARAERAEQRATAAEAELQAITEREENGDATAFKVAEIAEERDAALERAQAAEAALEEELSRLEEDLEEAGERDLERQREMEELLASEREQVCEWQGRASEAERRVRLLEAELGLLCPERLPAEHGLSCCWTRDGKEESSVDGDLAGYSEQGTVPKEDFEPDAERPSRAQSGERGRAALAGA